MNKTMARILVTVCTLVFIYLCIVLIASVVQLADAADRIYIGMGQPVFWILISVFLYFIISPAVLYFKLPKALIPPSEVSGPKHDAYLNELLRRLALNPRLSGYPLNSIEDISPAILVLSKEADKIIRETASSVFVGTAVMQNGRLDGLITLFTQARMVWRIASIYQQRPSPRQMLYLYTNVGATAFIAANIADIDFSALTAPIVVSILPSLKGGVPGLQGVSTLLINSLANGAANAFLTLRIGSIARQYSEALSYPSKRDVQRNATALAIGLIGQITKESSVNIVTNFWGAVKDTVVDAVDKTVDTSVQGIKGAAGKVSDTAISGAKVMSEALDSTVKGVKDVASKITFRKNVDS